jgi:glutathione S-transferase
VYERGVADLQVLANLLGARPFLHGDSPTSSDAAAYGFLANIHFFDIPTPLKAFIGTHGDLECYCLRVHAAVTK